MTDASSLPLVSVICLCYNHERFIAEALDSVLAQTYPNLEIIIMNDCSTDNSVAIIQEYVRQYPQLTFMSTGTNLGNTRAFNMAWRASKGDYIIDFATDDVLLPERVAQQVAAFEKLDDSYGVVYSDAEYIDDNGRHVKFHCQRNKAGEVVSFVPSGDIFEHLLSRYFICPPTMMMKRQVFEDLQGYDEALAYEDFDFWVRSSRRYKYFFLDAITTRRRLHAHSLSKQLYKPGDRQLNSTVLVCEKAAKLVQNSEERQALSRRLQYEARHAYLTGHYRQAEQFLDLLRQHAGLGPVYHTIHFLSKLKVDLRFIRALYQKLLNR
ncbi:glycosyltransferase [Pontibacter lucknowensis]|uniref:Glycosyltransferase involved in cell wall bisynthesis n=1 Tax=Pontibacter lucknowensis TaxID=1077936 RepID=A0A1N6TA79_9BACT|nr:glycosyltransferase [Pontibacter lucknowensis]SIQ50231.1 Glycosyltransferase involved in cell wall bisynthesis [Pontibacter lucknowensis]